MAAWDNHYRASGMPTRSTAKTHLQATTNALGSAFPLSSAAFIAIPSRYEFRFFTRIKHTGKVIYRGIGVGASHALNKCGYGVVVVIPFLSYFKARFWMHSTATSNVIVDIPILRPFSLRHSPILWHLRATLASPFARIRKKFQGILMKLWLVCSKPPFLIGHRPFNNSAMSSLLRGLSSNTTDLDTSAELTSK